MQDQLNKLLTELDEVINKAMDNYFEENATNLDIKLPYSTIVEYKTYSGKQFRRNKDQMSRNLTIEEAFAEFCQKQKEKIAKSNK